MRARDNEWAQLALELGGVETGAGREPVARGELEVAIAWPMGQDADEVAEVGVGVEAMEASGGDQRQQVAGRLGVIVAAREQPRFAAHGDAAELSLGGVVSQRLLRRVFGILPAPDRLLKSFAAAIRNRYRARRERRRHKSPISEVLPFRASPGRGTRWLLPRRLPLGYGADGPVKGISRGIRS